MRKKSTENEEWLDFRIQNVLADSLEGRLIRYIRAGEFRGVPINSGQFTLSILGMCLMPLVYQAEGNLSEKELQLHTQSCIQLIMLHVKLLCDISGLDLQTVLYSSLVAKLDVPQAEVETPPVWQEDIEENEDQDNQPLNLGEMNFEALNFS